VTETEFWALLELLDWDRTGDDEAVVAPVVRALSERPVTDIERFETIAAEKLHALDTEEHARRIGKHAYKGPNKPFSVDWFLYARCCVVANGRTFFEDVLANPAAMPEDIEFEALLSIASQAHELKTGEEFKFIPDVSYETFSNKAGWAAA
jgi:hypothetical protein